MINQPKSVRIFLKLFVVFQLFVTWLPGLRALTAFNGPDEEVRIGLLVPGPESLSAIQGAELAVRIANENGGMKGKPFRLLFRTMEGPWGTGSKQAVNLIFDEKVWALLGSHDGRNAHLVEQAATKSTVVFVSVWAGDPTLSQAFVPWFFNCVPNDVQQAEALIEEIYGRRRTKVPVIVYDDEYDSMQAMNNFLKRADQKHKPVPAQFHFGDYSSDLDRLSDKIDELQTDCLIFFCNPVTTCNIFLTISKKNKKLAFFCPLYILNEDMLTDNELKNFDDKIMVASGNYSEPLRSEFRKKYLETFGIAPGMVAAFAFDGMNALIHAIRKAGEQDREKIQKALSEISFDGVTGLIQFDERGNRSCKLGIMSVINGFPATPEKR